LHKRKKYCSFFVGLFLKKFLNSNLLVDILKNIKKYYLEIFHKSLKKYVKDMINYFELYDTKKKSYNIKGF
jgi:hypothetical protein